MPPSAEADAQHVAQAADVARRVVRMAAEPIEDLNRGMLLFGFKPAQRAIVLRELARQAAEAARIAEREARGGRHG